MTCLTTVNTRKATVTFMVKLFFNRHTLSSILSSCGARLSSTSPGIKVSVGFSFFILESGQRLVFKANTKKIIRKANTARPFVLKSPAISLSLLIFRDEKTDPTDVCGLNFWWKIVTSNYRMPLAFPDIRKDTLSRKKKPSLISVSGFANLLWSYSIYC